MSMMTCEMCSHQTDTDFNETYKLDDLIVCEGCYEDATNM